MDERHLPPEEVVARRDRRAKACSELFKLTLKYLEACQQGVVPKPNCEGTLHKWIFLGEAQLETAFQGHLDIGAPMAEIVPRKLKNLKEKIFELAAELPED